MAVTGDNSKGEICMRKGQRTKTNQELQCADDDTIRVAPKKEKKSNGTIKLKKPPPKHDKPGNWRDGSVIDDEKKSKDDTPADSIDSPGPVVNQLDDTARETFATGRPLEDSPDLQKCKHCKKSFLKTAAKAHVVACLKAKQDKAQRKKEQKEARDKAAREAEEAKRKDEEGDTKMDDDDDSDDDGSPEKKVTGVKSAKKSAGKKVDGENKGKKRKADGDAEKGPKQKKKKDEPKAKVPKPKGPVDVERQCGVLKDGVPCARSLTCKSHSMGAKRAVPGRSLPYDMLLAAYQKKNQAKQQKAAIDANAPLEDEDEENGPVDSDEELNATMAGLKNWNPQPVVQPLNPIPIERKYQLARLHEQLYNATNGFKDNIFKVVGYGAQKLPPGHPGNMDQDVDAPGEIDFGNGPMSAGLVSGMGGIAARRASGLNIQLPPSRKNSGSVVSARP
ncbi:hypothetical protein BP6252_12569 [Coleophoma cylindrospora]|uniref:SCA7 domain-containing protein n=1 Tax=Coleophoma cylindrospora TaxID=1849047 RepID=A0A3D8QCA3_9HELO|nr:hypothetical protein BP6252_12569 [Coleophoma cylindrospora]